ncbi:hypothetical protein BGZ63DRAFT_357632 [Mariannaea sp. PMI_226]|nr:hypothetical protein BGZ63DRAFT_357632 [Mariannaea sp. PMI_226]
MDGETPITVSLAAPSPPEPKVDNLAKHVKQTPQEIIDNFWSKFTTLKPGKVDSIIPANTYADIVIKKNLKIEAKNTQVSYDEAAAMCQAKVEKIVKECRRINKKYRDPYFDIQTDLKYNIRDCLHSLSNNEDGEIPGTQLRPQGAKRVGEIFDSPQFYIDGPTANDVRQGHDGDCWLMSSLCTLSNKKGLIEKLCVARDEAVGVYGFVFCRDGEWISEIVDDFLYLIKPDYDESIDDRILFDDVTHANSDAAYRKLYQSNSIALYFAQCTHPQEIWLPLLEKCYAKAHGDYSCIEGGYGGEALEDFTGGITSELWMTDILDTEHFWKEALLKVNEQFLFNCHAWGTAWGKRKGIIENHEYSIQKAVEIDGQRLLRLKNPWGKGEWQGAWSDGSKEWTPEWLTKLDHRFGDDGDFWISYEDFLLKYQILERTRLFGSEWRVTQSWTTLDVPWTVNYLDTYFSFGITKSGPVVIVLSQLDDRYFRGLQGQYWFKLHFRVHKAGHKDYIIRSQTPLRMLRSTNVELELEAGDYEVRIKVNATRYESVLPIDKVVRNHAKTRREKLIRIGLAYDLAHSRGRVIKTPEEKAAQKAHKNSLKQKTHRKLREKFLKEREETHYLATKSYHRKLKKHLRKKEKRMAKLAEKTTGKEAANDKGNQSEDNKCSSQNEAEVAEKHADESREKAFKKRQNENKAEKQENMEQQGEESDASDISSVGALSELSEREIEITLDALQCPTTPTPPKILEEEPDEFEQDPWNAVVVVGLRIYYKAGEGDENNTATLKVVRPIHFDVADKSGSDSGSEDGEEKDGDEQSQMKSLDVDDSAKDATLQGEVADRKKSIMGGGRG